MGADWTAIATAGMAVVTAAMAWETRRMAKRTAEEATATARSADATLELARLGRLGYQPVLAVAIGQTYPASSADGHRRSLSLRNVGAGPAIGCLYASQDEGRWCMTPLLHLAAGKSTEAVIAHNRGANPEQAWWTPSDSQAYMGTMSEVMFCRDIFNRRYRFLIDSGGHVLDPEIKPAEDCHGTAGGDWWTDHALWGLT